MFFSLHALEVGAQHSSQRLNQTAFFGEKWSFVRVGASFAIDDFNRAIELDPSIAWAYFNRGLVKVYLGDEAAAQKDFDECLRLKPELKSDLELKIDLARHLRRIGKSEE